ncbi:MAG: glycosyltransferase family 4 protein [Bacteroidota bacterium]
MNNRIVILTQYYPPEMGAPQSRLFETAQGLKKRGWDVRIVTSMPNYPTGKIFNGYKRKIYSHETHEGIHITRTWIYASNSKKAFPRIVSMLSFSFTCLLTLFALRKFKPAFILTESPPLTLALSGITLSALCSARHIMNVSDIWPLSAFELGAVKKGTLYSILDWLEKQAYRNSYAATGQSEEILTHLKKAKIKHVHLCRNGVDINRFAQKSAYETHDDTLRIVYAGLLGVAQGIYDLCTHIDYASLGAELHIYGDGAEQKMITDYIDTHPGCGVVYHGKAGRNEIPTILSTYQCTIIPLIKPIYGAVPSKIYEAMAAGLPIIFAGGGEGAKIIRDHRCGWICEPLSFIEMSAVLEKIKSTPREEMKRLSENGRNAAIQFFNRETQIDSLHHFLTSIVCT